MERLVVVCVLIVLSRTAVASEDETTFYVAPRVGLGLVHVDAFSGVNKFAVERDTLNLGVSGGYVTPFGLSVELGLDSQTSSYLFGSLDEFTLYEEFALVGYRIPLSDRIRFTAKTGISRWTLESKEGLLLNPGTEEVKTIDGYQTIWEVEVTGKVNSFLSLGGALRRGDFEFGNAASISFVMQFNF